MFAISQQAVLISSPVHAQPRQLGSFRLFSGIKSLDAKNSVSYTRPEDQRVVNLWAMPPLRSVSRKSLSLSLARLNQAPV